MLYCTEAVVCKEKVVDFVGLLNRKFLGNFNKPDL